MYKAIRNVSVLDPTCGSGAFLFAALNILDPLHDACLDRMQAFVTDLDQSGTEHSPEKYRDFRQALAELERHPSQGYFVLKQIVLNNLYGVDIMAEAVEICKLRLFLKLVAQLDDKSQIEPHPDIDFNIRAGNTLVGFATRAEVARSLTMGKPGQVRMVLDDDRATLARIEEQLAKADLAFEHFREIQQHEDDKGGQSLADAKAEYRERLSALNDELDRYQAGLYGINPDWPKTVAAWKESHQPFHWFVDFHGIMSTGGFNVIIGNPPYVEYSKILGEYRIINYQTEVCGNLYAYVMERSRALMNPDGYYGMIVPMSGHSTSRMQPLIDLFYRGFRNTWIMNLSGDANPSVLFQGVKFRLSIVLARQRHTSPQVRTTRYRKWFGEERAHLFALTSYENADSVPLAMIPKIADSQHADILDKLLRKRTSLSRFLRGEWITYFHNAPVSWIRAHSFIPYFHSERDGEKPSTQLKPLRFSSESEAFAASGAISSSVFYLWWVTSSDCYHLNQSEIHTFPIDFSESDFVEDIASTSHRLMKDLQRHSRRRTYRYRTSGLVQYDEFYPKQSKPIIDEIDRVLAEHYGFTDEELDFIINYDIKYRMGRGAGDDDA